MTKLLPAIAFSAFALSFSQPASAQTVADTQCFANDQFFVFTQTYQDLVGTDFRIVSLKDGQPAPACDESVSTEFEIGLDQDAYWFEGLKDHYLILSASTGPATNIAVFDLDTREKIIDVPAEPFFVTDNALAYFELDEDGNADNCPQFAKYSEGGLGARIGHLKMFYYADGTMNDVGYTTCVGEQ